MTETRVSMIMASTADGKITLPYKEKVKFASLEDRAFLEQIRYRSDCIVRGAENVKMFGSAAILEDLLQRAREIESRRKNPLNVVLSSSLDFDYENLAYFRTPNAERVIFTSTETPAEKINHAKRWGRLVRVGLDDRKKLDVRQVLDHLYQVEHCSNILVEGGGDLNFSMFYHGLVDEIFLTLCPYIIGGSSSVNFVCGDGFPKEKVPRLKLVDAKVGTEEEIFIHYLVLKGGNTSYEPIRGGWEIKPIG